MRLPSEAATANTARIAAPSVATEAWAREVFWAADALAARSVQKRIGPSEAGNPCDRAVASKVQGIPATRPNLGGNMASIAGTGIHDWIGQRIETLFGASQRYLVETKVEYRGIGGTADLFDRRENRVVDWKTKAPNAVRQIKRERAWRPEWIVQTNIYGAGMAARGEQVDEVSIVVVPREGSIDEIVALVRPFEIEVADRAIDRVERLSTVDPDSLPPCGLTFCDYCPR